MMKIRLTYKRPTALICSVNAFLIVYVIYAVFVIPQNFKRSQRDLVATVSIPAGNVTLIPVKYTREQMERINSAEAARKALDAVDLTKRIAELRMESSSEISKIEKNTDEVADEFMESSGDGSARHTDRDVDLATRNGTGSKDFDDGESDGLILYPMGNLTETKREKGKLELHGPEIEDGIIPGKPLPPECNGQAHTDYDGFAVTWGLTHRQESAADCCSACLKQAAKAKKGENKCNLWVYCPAEEGCYSPDVYVHKEFECWLKYYDDEPRLNFKGKYDEEYRLDHPTCPVVVPWISGVIR